MKTSQWIKPFLFTLLMLVVPIGSYYIYFVEARETFLLERFHAHLANIASRTEDRFSSAFDVIKNNPDQRNAVGLKKWECLQTPSVAGENTDDQKASTDDQKASTDEQKEFVVKSSATELTFHTTKCSAAADIATLVGTIDPEGQFNDVLIFDENNKFVFRRDPENGRIGGDQLFTREGASGAGGSGTGDSKSNANGTVKDPLVGIRTSYQGRPFLVFEQPMEISAKQPSKGTWKVIGLVGQAEFTQLKYSVRPGGIALVALTVFGVLLAAPFLKIRYLGRFESLSRFDMFLQAGAALTLVAVGTVAWLAWDTHVRLEKYFDKRLVDIAGDLAKAAGNEFGAAAATLDRLEPLMRESYAIRKANQAAPWGTTGVPECPKLAGSLQNGRPEPQQLIPTAAGNILLTPAAATEAYRQMNQVYLMDQSGCQIVKWSNEEKGPKPGWYGDRKYFRSALPDRRVWDDLNPTKPPTFADVVIARTTGERQLVVSKPVSDATDPCTEAIRKSEAKSDGKSGLKDDERVPCVSAIAASLRALDSVLPYGFGAMLVDADTKIVWRGAGDASTEVNLAKEVDEPERLRTLVRLAIRTPSREGESFDADYHRKPHRFRVVPLEVVPFVLVAFYNRNLVTGTVLESAGVASTAWFSWVAILGALAFVLWVIDNMTGRALRRWPYRLIIAVPAAIALTWIAVAVSLALFLAAVVAALCVIPLLWLGRDSSRMNPQWRRMLVVGPVWLALMMAGSVPTILLYRQAERASLDALARFDASDSGGRLVAQGNTFDQWKHKVGLQDQAGLPGFETTLRNRNLIERLPLPLPLPLQKAAAGAQKCDLLDVVCGILTNLPDYSADLSGIHAMHRQGRVLGADAGTDLLADVPATYFFHVVVALVGLLLSFVGVWYLLVRAFGLRVENVVEARLVDLPTGSEKAQHNIVYGWSVSQKQEHREKLVKAGKVWLDLRDTSPDSPISISRSADVVALDEFDSNLNDIAVVRQRVELLERLLREDHHRVILLFVGTDPLNFVTAQYDADKNAPLLSRFATAMARFKFTYGAGAGSAAATEEEKAFDMLGTLRPFPRRSTQPSQPSWREMLVRLECRHPDLWEIRDDLIDEAEKQEWSEGQIIQQIQSRANAFYQQAWSKCTRVEKFTLIELALRHPINPNNWDAARRLRMRGFVRAAPFYRIASENLRHFVARMDQVENVQRWRAENPGAWGQIKVPLFVLILGVVIFLAITQPDLFNSLYAFAAAGVAAFPFLVNALNARLQKSPSRD